MHDVERRDGAREVRGEVVANRSCEATSGRLARGLQAADELRDGVGLHFAQQPLLLRVARQHFATR